MSPRILVVDDEPGIRDLFNRVVGGLGHEVIAVASAEEALKRFRDGRYDVVFCDLMLSGMNGLDLMRSLQKARPRQAVAVMTAYPTPDIESGARLLGAFAFLSKPCRLREIEAAIAAAVSQRDSDG